MVLLLVIVFVLFDYIILKYLWVIKIDFWVSLVGMVCECIFIRELWCFGVVGLVYY